MWSPARNKGLVSCSAESPLAPGPVDLALARAEFTALEHFFRNSGLFRQYAGRKLEIGWYEVRLFHFYLENGKGNDGFESPPSLNVPIFLFP